MSAPNPAEAIVLATRNRGKIREFAALLSPLGLTVLGLDEISGLEDVEETGTSFAENALLKAGTAARHTGLVCVADDSGLEVDALGGAPGVYSARFSATDDSPATDERNTQKLLGELAGLPAHLRKARFRCCMVACAPGGSVLMADGAWEGLIAMEPKGTNGFGYDPVFFDEELGKTAAELPAEQKNARSHRARAVRALLAQWPEYWRKWLAEIA